MYIRSVLGTFINADAIESIGVSKRFKPTGDYSNVCKACVPPGTPVHLVRTVSGDTHVVSGEEVRKVLRDLPPA